MRICCANYLENKGSLFQSTSDSEVFAHLIKKEVRNHNRPRIYSIIEALNMLEGAFAFLVMTANCIYACATNTVCGPFDR